MSHPMRVRGLKLAWNNVENGLEQVAPHAGAWIEIPSIFDTMQVQ